jgi:sulfide dehydrogenase cytochrome subunit
MITTKQRFFLPSLLALGALTLAASVVQAADISTPAVLAGSCSTCHGPNGQSPGAMPSLAGLEPKYIMTRLKEFRSGEAPATLMNRIAKGYSDAEIEALGQYFTKTKP